MTVHDILTAFSALPPDQQQVVAAEILRRAPAGGDFLNAARHKLASEVIQDSDVAEEDSEEHVHFPEEEITVLSDRDRDRFLELINNPPPPNEALRKAFARHRKTDA